MTSCWKNCSETTNNISITIGCMGEMASTKWSKEQGMNITILEELKNLIPPLTEGEYKQLEENCLEYGIREPLSVWKNGNESILIDGHNRYQIATEHSLDYAVKEYSFDGLTEVKTWIIKNQLGRRNITAFQRVELVLPLKEEIAQEAHERQRGGQGGVLLLQNSARANTRETLADLAGVSRDTVSKVEQILSRADGDTIGRLRSGKQSINEAFQKVRREERDDDRRQEIRRLEAQCVDDSSVNSLYDVIVMDPPWEYRTSEKSTRYKRIESPYPSMSLEQIKAIEVPAAEDCTMFLWTTQSWLPYAFEVLAHWGFSYKTTLIWDKQLMGMGDVIRIQTEFCLMGTKGTPVFKPVHNIRDIMSEKRREHSRKPDAFYDMVDSLCVGRKLDYFSRQHREGWDCVGNDTSKFDFEG